MKRVFNVEFDNGKPYTERFKGEKALLEGLTAFYDANKENSICDAMVYENGNNITESQFINEHIGGLLDD